MKFLATVLFAAIAMASPQSDGGGAGNSDIKFPVDPELTIQQAEAKCGNDAQVFCCNKAMYTHDITTSDTDPLPGVVQTALGGGPGGDGLGLFGQCKDMTARVPVLNVVGGGVDRKAAESCKRNIACCPSSSAESNGNLVGADKPCVAVGSLL
ncbi:uncharacterized protein APUU_50040S [Aspergillus puulaauensis]|uniref:Hydrophobin n=1 Tax=Aspergillus puulaauensis TaxID=1220207 RepID=A0A7R8AMS3_9EURO|nr:uncharacterized protein APUU_50040S [Aspergillus puulaauensis]BCS25329.1 hypothetical protein APUU_50040S [Aspergillus puulaauensis]